MKRFQFRIVARRNNDETVKGFYAQYRIAGFFSPWKEIQIDGALNDFCEAPSQERDLLSPTIEIARATIKAAEINLNKRYYHDEIVIGEDR
jgi:hypothetical protein